MAIFDDPEADLLDEDTFDAIGAMPMMDVDEYPDTIHEPRQDEPGVPDFVAGERFAGKRFGMVFTTRDGVPGYYADTGSCRKDENDSRATDIFQYLQGLPWLDDLRRAVHIELDTLVPGVNHRWQWQMGQKRAPRCRNGRRRDRRRCKQASRRHTHFDEGVNPVKGTTASDDSFRKAGLFAIDTVNPNIASGALRYLGVSAADALRTQELRTFGNSTISTEKAARNFKWVLSANDATMSDAGSTSAGVGVAIRSNLGMSRPPFDCDCGIDARFMLRWAGTLIRGGFFLGSIYLRTTEGLSAANLDILHKAAGVLARVKGQWVVGGDWNTPEVLVKSGWLNLVKGTIRRPNQATCNANEYDFFVSSQGIAAGVVGVAVISDGGFTPHSPVRLYLRSDLKQLIVRKLKAPPKIEADVPSGCLPNVSQKIDAVTAAVEGMIEAHELDSALAAWTSAVEEELADMRGIDEKARSIACCRAKGPQFVLCPAVGSPGSSEPMVSPTSLGWRVMAGCLRDFWIGMGSSNAQLQAKAKRAQWRLQVHPWKSRRPSVHFDKFRQWAHFLQESNLADRNWVLQVWLAVKNVAERTGAHDDRRRNLSWSSWLREGPARGLSRQHKMSRVSGGWVPAVVGQTPNLVTEELDLVPESSLEPVGAQALSDLKTNERSGIWDCNPEPSDFQWPVGMGDYDLPEVTSGIICQAAFTFPSGTGLGWDKLHPRALRRIPAELLRLFAKLLVAIEMSGEWPLTIGVVLICFIPKSDGGLRPIGLLPSLIRFRMRIHLTALRAWQAAHERPYFYVGPSRGAVAASGKQAAWAEVTRCIDGAAYAIALLDLVKAFDRIPHWYLLQQAVKYHFNLFLLRLSVAAYRMGRAIGINAVFGSLVFADRGITAGSVSCSPPST